MATDRPVAIVCVGMAGKQELLERRFEDAH